MRGLGLVVGMAALVVAAALPVGATPSTKMQTLVRDDLSSGSRRFVVEGIPGSVSADNYKISFFNGSIGPHVLIAFKIPNGMTAEEFHASLDGPPPEDSFFVSAVFAAPGHEHQKQYDLTLPGTYGYFCPIQTPAGVPHYDMGFVGVFEVAAS